MTTYAVKSREGQTLVTFTSDNPTSAFLSAQNAVRVNYAKAGITPAMFDCDPPFYAESQSMTSITLTLTIKTDNDAFQPSPEPELARIFRTLATCLDSSADLPILVKDSNGNLVGALKEDPS